MPTVVRKSGCSGSDGLEKGIRTLRKSKLMTVSNFKTMFLVIEKHQQDLKLAHITGKPKDLMDNTEKDTKFFQLLSNMLCEVLKQNLEKKSLKTEIQKVYLWYQANKHQLHNGPRFGKENQKKEAEDALRRLRSLGNFRFEVPYLPDTVDPFTNHSPRQEHDTDLEFELQDLPESEIVDSCDDHTDVNSELDLDLTTEIDLEEVLNQCDESDEEEGGIPTEVIQFHVTPKPHSSTFSSPVNFKHRKVKPPVSRGPQKIIHSIASLVNPHTSTSSVQGDNSDCNDRSSKASTTVVFRPITAPNSRADMLKTWQTFHKERTYGQDIIGKMNFVGRSGTGLDIRYNAHQSAEMPEEKTRHLIREITRDGRKSRVTKSPRSKENVLTSQTLEDFYETADKFYPLKVPKLSTNVPRTPSSKSRQTTATPLGRKLITAESSGSLKEEKTNIKLDTLVTMIDDVTDNMETYKEKLIQPPSLGFRRPAVNDIPTTPTPCFTPANFVLINQSMRSDTPLQPPPSATAGQCVTPHPPLPSHTTSTPLPPTPLPGVDWRGKVTPDPTRYRLRSKFKGHSYVQKGERSSVRSAGSVTPGHRPKTAPGFTKTKWRTERESDCNERLVGQASSHMTTCMDQSELDNMMVIQHLLGDSASQEGSMYEFDMDFLRRMRRLNYSSGPSTSQQREYFTFIAGNSHPGDGTNRSVSAPVGFRCKTRTVKEERSEKTCQSPGGFSSIGEFDEEGVDTVEEELKHIQDDLIAPSEMDDPEENPETKQQEEEDKESYDVEICAVPSEGAGPLPENKRSHPLQTLTISDSWQFSPLSRFHGNKKQDPSSWSRSQSAKLSRDDSFTKITRPMITRQSLKAESCHIDGPHQTPVVRVERSAGRMPGFSHCSTSEQLLLMAQRQREILHRAPPIRTPPSIPSPYSSLGGRGGRGGRQGVYQKELDDHARRTTSPRRYMEHVRELREGLHTAPTLSTQDENQLIQTLTVHPVSTPTTDPILKPQSAMPYLHYREQQHRPCDVERQVRFHPSYPAPRHNDTPRSDLIPTPDSNLRSKLEGKVKVEGSRSQHTTPFVKIGRPIAQVQTLKDPDLEQEASNLLKQTSAAVDIQRIFRGYVARNVYKNLLREERERKEDARKAALEIQRHYRGHLARKTAIKHRDPPAETREWARQYKMTLQEREGDRHRKLEQVAKQNAYNYITAANKLSEIGPHVEIYQVYHPKHVGATRFELDNAAVMVQKLVRGWIVRRKMERLRRKATWYGSEFNVMVKDYKKMLMRIQKLHGVEKYQTPFSIAEMNSYMDGRRRYEGVFERRSFGGELESGDLDQFFKECDLFPSQTEIEDARERVCRKPGEVLKREKGISKCQILDMLYYIYTPTATGLVNTRTSTWMNPIIDGQEAKKLIGSDMIEAAPLEKCAELVIESKRRERERVQKMEEEKKE